MVLFIRANIMKIQKGKNNITWLGYNFKKHFGDMEFEREENKLYTKILENPMLDKEILDELKPTECTLTDLLTVLEGDYKDIWNIFYIRDEEGTLWAVSGYWRSDYRGWFVEANSIEYPDRWDDGYQVFSRDSFGSLNLGNSETIERAIETVKEAGYKVIKEL